MTSPPSSPNTGARQNPSITRIPHGLTNDSWLLEIGQNAFVIRFSTHKSEHLNLNRYNEQIILTVVAAAGIGAKIVCVDPKKGLLITEYLAGCVWQKQDTLLPKNIERLVPLLQQVHRLPIPQDTFIIDYSDILNHYWRVLKRPPDLSLLRLSDALFKTRQSAVCHHDINHLNIIDNGIKIWLIDWEYAGIGDPFFDLASIACYHDYSTIQKKQLLECYFGTITPMIEQRFNDITLIFQTITKLWFDVQRQ